MRNFRSIQVIDCLDSRLLYALLTEFYVLDSYRDWFVEHNGAELFYIGCRNTNLREPEVLELIAQGCTAFLLNHGNALLNGTLVTVAGRCCKRSELVVMIQSVEIEACTMSDMARTLIIPAMEAYAADMAGAAASKRAIAPALKCGYEAGIVTGLSELADTIAVRADELDAAMEKLRSTKLRILWKNRP